MAIVVVLAGVGWLIIRQLMADSKLQDCVMSGRKNCAPVEIDSAGR
jgi:cell division septal protein FtsQ